MVHYGQSTARVIGMERAEEQVEAFSHALESDLGRLLPFEELLDRFLHIAVHSSSACLILAYSHY
eukprot:5327186-Amphidinium_carterae.1